MRADALKRDLPLVHQAAEVRAADAKFIGCLARTQTRVADRHRDLLTSSCGTRQHLEQMGETLGDRHRFTRGGAEHRLVIERCGHATSRGLRLIRQRELLNEFLHRDPPGAAVAHPDSKDCVGANCHK